MASQRQGDRLGPFEILGASGAAGRGLRWALAAAALVLAGLAVWAIVSSARQGAQQLAPSPDASSEASPRGSAPVPAP